MFHSETEILTSNGWMKCSDLYTSLSFKGGVDVATVVNNSIMFSKVSECGFYHKNVDMISFKNNEKKILNNLIIGEQHEIYYSNIKNGKIISSRAYDLIGKNIFIPRSLFIPDEFEISPEIQEHISLMGLISIFYFNVEAITKECVILSRENEDIYNDDLKSHVGFLKLKIEESNKEQIKVFINPTIYGLLPLSSIYEHDKYDLNFKSIKYSKLFPQWIFNAHPYTQREFIRILLNHVEKLDRKKSSPWDSLPIEHVGKIMSLGIQCGFPVYGRLWKDLKTNNCDNFMVNKFEGIGLSDGCYSFIVEPTNIICIKFGKQTFICSGGNYENKQ